MNLRAFSWYTGGDAFMTRKIDWESQIGRRLKLRDLHVFVTVVKRGSMAKAANQLGVSHAAVSEVIADLERSKGMYAWASVQLKEGKNREVKRLMESLGLKVARLIRVQFGPFHLGQLAEGAVEEIPARLWREQLGIGRKKRL